MTRRVGHVALLLASASLSLPHPTECPNPYHVLLFLHLPEERIIHIHIHAYIHTHIHTHLHTYTHTHIHTCTYITQIICIYIIYTHTYIVYIYIYNLCREGVYMSLNILISYKLF